MLLLYLPSKELSAFRRVGVTTAKAHEQSPVPPSLGGTHPPWQALCVLPLIPVRQVILGQREPSCLPPLENGADGVNLTGM